MSHAPFAILWEPAATNSAAGFLLDDAAALQAVFTVVDALAADPQPPTSAPFGPGRRRLRAGRYRVLYEVDEPARSVIILHIGRTSS